MEDSATLSILPASQSQAQAGEQEVRRHGSGLPEPFERLFLAEYTRVVGIANRVLANRHEAEEVAQEVFLEFHRNHPAEADYAAPWLHRAAWHRALNVLRGNRRRTSREEAVAMPESDLSADPEGLVQEAAQRQRVREAMSRLPRKSAAVLALRYSGLSYAEVAGAMGVSVGQVGTLLRRAEMKLRSEVQK
ncbi:MAG TPA: sigma-70 family RNA polymerase sigma factor [Candidatus Dormibacteraeota bacterium]|nr:sigma-70 family RNA polymerase sigma factor [Candidatus Dormibacteraeota bacterium]